MGASLREKYNPMIRQLRQMETIVIAAVNGVAAGAGCNFALACDLRVASEEAKFIQTPAPRRPRALRTASLTTVLNLVSGLARNQVGQDGNAIDSIAS